MTRESVSWPTTATNSLLQSIVTTARAIFASAAASIFVVDDMTGELVFRAVAGEGAGELVGRRFAADTGIAGWVIQTGQPMLVSDLSSTSIFSRSAAESTGFVPDTILAAPLLGADRCLGVLEVLDPTAGQRGRLADVDLLALFAEQATIALAVVQEATTLGSGPFERPWPGGWEATISRIPAHRAAAAREVIVAVEGFLAEDLEAGQ